MLAVESHRQQWELAQERTTMWTEVGKAIWVRIAKPFGAQFTPPSASS
jgi:hypothetical protein